MLPGEPEARTAEARAAAGIVLSAAIVDDLMALAGSLAVDASCLSTA